MAYEKDQYDGGYANGADGSCHNCGADTEEEHHALCTDCWREEQGYGPRRSTPSPFAGDAPSRSMDFQRGYRSGYIAGLADARGRVA